MTETIGKFSRDLVQTSHYYITPTTYFMILKIDKTGRFHQPGSWEKFYSRILIHTVAEDKKNEIFKVIFHRKEREC
jgi:hypothetical protein